MFRRTKLETDSHEAVPPKPGGKGRPTPTRREAEAAAKARAKTPRTRKELAAAQRQARAESGNKMRQAMKTGDNRYLPERDRGPVKAFIRDFVDCRLTVIEILMPLVLVTILAGFFLSPKIVGMLNALFYAAILIVIIEMVLLRFRLRKEIARRFPTESAKGTAYYAIMRSLSMRFMRLPKPQVKIGQSLPEHYR